MPDQDLLSYIKEESKRGIDKQTLNDNLIAKGWQQAQIDEAFINLQNSNTAPPPPQIEKEANYLPGFRGLLSEAWQIYKQRWKTLVSINLIPFLFLIPLLVLFILYFFISKSLLNPSSPNIILTIVFLIVIAFCAVGFFLLSLWSPVAFIFAIKERSRQIGFKSSYGKSRGKVIPYIVLSFIIGFFVVFGFILLFSPGIVFMVWFNFALFALIYENSGVIGSLKKSRKYVKGKFFDVFYRVLAIGLFIQIVGAVILSVPLLNLFSLIINYLILAPLSTIYSVILYEKLKDLDQKPLSNPISRVFTAVILFAFILAALCAIIFAGVIGYNLFKGNGKNKPLSSLTRQQQTNVIQISPKPGNISAQSQTQGPKTNMTALANDTTRRNDILQILNALGAYAGDHQGNFPPNMPQVNGSPLEISSSGANICSALVPKYLAYLPQDPSINNGTGIKDCNTTFDTGYKISMDLSGRITVYAPLAQNGTISDSR